MDTHGDWGKVAEAMKDARGVAADSNGVKLAAEKWAKHDGYYTVYWEIGMDARLADLVMYEIKLIDYDTNTAVAAHKGWASTEEDARRESQQWVLDHINNYRVEA